MIHLVSDPRNPTTLVVGSSILSVFAVGTLTFVDTVESASTVNETIKIKNGEINILKPYSETALKGKFQLNVDSNQRAHVSVSNYKKLVNIIVTCYFVSRTTHMDAFGRPSSSTYRIDTSQFPGYVGDFKPDEVKKTNKGYNSKASFSYAMTGGFANPGAIKSIELEFEKQPDLKLQKITKKGGKHVVNVKNDGDARAKASKMGIYVNKKLIQTVTIPAIEAGKSRNVR